MTRVARRRRALAIDRLMAPMLPADEPGGVLSVFEDGRAVHVRTYGRSDVRGGCRVGPQTRFNIGSTSKQFTVMCIHLLGRDGLLSVRDEVHRYIPELPRYAWPIRLHHLIHHTSGLRSYTTLDLLAGRSLLCDDRAHVLNVIRRQRALNCRPGDAFDYSNTGYFLLALVVERVSGASFREFVRRNIFVPLAMRRTLVRSHRWEPIEHLAHGYSRVGPGRFTRHAHGSIGGRGAVGAGEIMTTAADMQRWAANFRTARVGGRATIRAMETPGRLNSGKPAGYGGGLFLSDIGGRRVVSHGGGLPGFRSDLIRLPDRRLSVAVFLNRDDLDPYDIGCRVAKLWMDPITPREPPVTAAPRRVVAHPMPIAVLRSHEGVFRQRTGGKDRWAFVADGKQLHLKATWGRRVLIPIRPHGFQGEGEASASEFYFSFDPGGRPSSLVEIKQGKPFQHLQLAVAPAPPVGFRLRQFAGRYRSDELDAVFQVTASRWWLSIRPAGLAKADPQSIWRMFLDANVYPHDRRGDRFFGPSFGLRFRRAPGGTVAGVSIECSAGIPGLRRISCTRL